MTKAARRLWRSGEIDAQTYKGQAITFNDGLKDVTYKGLENGGLETAKELTYGATTT